MPILSSRCWLEGFSHSLAAGSVYPQTARDVLQLHRVKRLRAGRLITARNAEGPCVS
jgi:hypothetical protein